MSNDSDFHMRGTGKIAKALFEEIEDDPRIVSVMTVHSMISGAIGLIPIPTAGIFICLGNIYTMYARINSILGIPFTKNIIKSIAGMVASNLAGYAGLVATTFVGEGLKFIPFIGSFAGGALMAVSYYAMTGVQGKIYCQWLRMMAGKSAIREDGTFDENEGKATMDEIFKDKSKIQDMIDKERREAKGKEFSKFKGEAQKVVNEYKQEKKA